MTPRKQWGWCPDEVTETLAAWTVPVRVQIRQGPSTGRGMWAWVPALTKKLFASVSFWEGENQFPPWSGTVYINHTPGQFPWPEAIGQCKINSVDPCFFFFFLSLSFVCVISFILFWHFLSYWLLFALIFFKGRKRERHIHRAGRERSYVHRGGGGFE